MSENDIALLTKCAAVLCEQVGIVETERFIYLVRSEAFDYTKWQREHYDAISPDEFDAALEQFSSKNEFKGNKAKII